MTRIMTKMCKHLTDHSVCDVLTYRKKRMLIVFCEDFIQYPVLYNMSTEYTLIHYSAQHVDRLKFKRTALSYNTTDIFVIYRFLFKPLGNV